MASLPWYFKQVGKPKSKKGKLVYTYRLHWIYIFYITIKIMLRQRFKLTEKKSKLKML